MCPHVIVHAFPFQEFDPASPSSWVLENKIKTKSVLQAVQSCTPGSKAKGTETGKEGFVKTKQKKGCLLRKAGFKGKLSPNLHLL